MAPLPRVFITRRLPPEVLRLLEGKVALEVGPEGARIERHALLEGAAQAEALVPMLNDKIDRALLESAPSLKLVANYAAGYDNVDLKAAEELGIWVTNTPDATTDSTADLAMTLMLGSARHLPMGETALRRGEFVGWSPTAFLGVQLAGRTLGIIGMGRIGRAVAKRAAAFGMRVLYLSRRPLSGEEERALGVEAGSRPLAQLLPECDFLSLHCPLTAQTRHLIDREALALLKPTARIINTSRGAVLDEEALARALHEGRLAGAALDVYEGEPAVHPLLLSAPGALLLPHLGTSTLAARLAMAERAFGEVTRVLSGARPLYAVNTPARPRSEHILA